MFKMLNKSGSGFVLLLFTLLAGCGGKELAPVSDKPQGGRAGERNGQDYHQVQRGESLSLIARQYGADFRDFAEWNDIEAPYVIYPGQRLLIVPPGKSARSGTAAPGTPGVQVNKLPRSSAPTALPITPEIRKAEPRVPDSVGKWAWPAEGKLIQGYSATEKGLSFAGNEGQPVLAAAAGDVVYRGSGLVGLGELVIVKHNKTFLSAYAHNKKILVKEGEKVALGQQIAEMGSTATDRVKLYFEIRVDGKPVNPLLYLPRRN